MPITHGVVTVATTAAAVSASVTIGDPPMQLCLQADPANTAVIYVGGAGVTTTSYGYLLPAPVSTVPAAPLIIGPESGAVNVSELYLVATNTTQKVRILSIT